MKEIEKVYKNRMSMFDLLKGFAIFIVVFWHTYDYWNGNPALIGVQIPLNLIWLGLMPAFLLASGYWFKPKPVKSYTKSQISSLMKPYAFVGIMAAGCCAVINFLRFHTLRSAYGGARGIVLGFLTGSQNVYTIKGRIICNLGPAWFLFTLCWAGIILNLIMKSSKIKYKKTVIGILLVIGIILERAPWLPLCPCGVLEAVFTLYCGYCLKESKFLIRKWYVKDYVILTVLVILGYIVGIGIMFAGGSQSYIARIVPGIPHAVVYMRIALHLEHIQNRFTDFVRKLGRYSLWIFVVHSIEVLSFDWHLLSEREIFMQNPVLGLIVIFAIRVCVIFTGCFIVAKIDKFLLRRTKHGIF